MLNGLKTRFAGLNGHIVSEILTDRGWCIADPDYGVSYPSGLKGMEKKENGPLIRQKLTKRGYKKKVIDEYIERFQSSGDNTVTEIDVALSPRLYVVERAAEWLKWIIPLIMIFSGLIFSKENTARRS